MLKKKTCLRLNDCIIQFQEKKLSQLLLHHYKLLHIYKNALKNDNAGWQLYIQSNTKIAEIFNKKCSIPNFAVLLMEAMFTKEELNDFNTNVLSSSYFNIIFYVYI